MILKYRSLLAFMMLVFAMVSCVEEVPNAVSGAGTRKITFSAGEFSIVTFKKNSIEKKALITIYRNEVSSGTMNETVTLDFELSQDSLDAYNDKHETNYTLVPEEAYSLNINEGTLTFAPGESAKSIIITINTSLMDLSKKNVLPFLISDVSGGQTLTDHTFAIVQALPINEYDGRYTYAGFLGRYNADGSELTDDLRGTVVGGVVRDLATVGEFAVEFSPVWANGTGLVGGVGVPVIHVDQATNEVTLTTDPTPANWGPIPDMPNYYDPETKTFYINWKWGGASASPTGTTRSMSLVMKYSKAR